MKTSNLDRKMAEWFRKNPLVAGEVRYVSVAHDDWCRFIQHKGDCNCNPEFSYNPHVLQPGDVLGVHVLSAPPAKNN